MDWLSHHKRSETLATQAHKLLRGNLQSAAHELFRLAAEEEEIALSMLDASKSRTLGILAVSTVALWYKGRNFEKASFVANTNLENNEIKGSARDQLLDLVATLSQEKSTEEAFNPIGLAPAQFTGFALDAILSLTNVGLQATERIAALNLSTTHAVLEISANNQKALAEMLEIQLGDLQKAIAALSEQETKSAPAGSDVAVAAIQSALAAANSAFGNITKAAKQASEIAEASVVAATFASSRGVAGRAIAGIKKK